ncbi:hypothetical protein FHW84_002520 [Dyella sp. SG562]|uniref:hypothetical protein n=1 Tax=Dyella sp. SG562 TaxID=2587017 RepID=UPI00141E1653|nr:hypothetical protein [Dyella sp. SG562]NII73947.1 hypothetical protein [Dyella sp. SG562]
MCLTDLIDYSPDQRESIARVESLRMMREIRMSYRANLSMPANAGDANPCAELAAAGAYLEDVA